MKSSNNWQGGVNVGFALARGNSDTTNLNTGFTADRKTRSDEIKLYSSSIYSTNGGTTAGAPGGVTANSILGGFNYSVNQLVVEVCKTFCAFGVAFGFSENFVAFAHIGESVIEKCENVWCNFFSESIASAEVLIDPYLHLGSPFS